MQVTQVDVFALRIPHHYKGRRAHRGARAGAGYRLLHRAAMGPRVRPALTESLFWTMTGTGLRNGIRITP
jgi:hypothetical protein